MISDIQKKGLLQNGQAFAVTRSLIGQERFKKIVLSNNSMDGIVDAVLKITPGLDLPGWFDQLAAMEAHWVKLTDLSSEDTRYSPRLELNPGLKIFSNTWQHLACFFDPDQGQCTPEPGTELAMVWPDNQTGLPTARAADNSDLLVLKMVLEHRTPEQVTQETNRDLSDINALVLASLNAGIILGPEPGIIRKTPCGSAPESRERGLERENELARFKKSRVFALQWHITQACDLHCRHCYDRTPAAPLPLDQEIKVLDSLADFCDTHHLFGQVTFTGGNPLLHPHFLRLYQEAARRGFFLGILGNPASIEMMDKICAIQPPSFFQVSLEGLEPHNDYIRGPGHFKRILTFLKRLKKARIYSKVMLTLTRANAGQVLALGEVLRNRTDQFTFNRLSLQGEGANLTMADIQDYDSFLESYAIAANNNPTLGFKDNLFNILHLKSKTPLFGGCTGFGCGAAFNFVSLLPTGEVHACRKFPSPLGNITQRSLAEIYHSKTAQQYRRGPEDCISCDLNLVCRGCLASSHSQGLDVFSQKDPYCFQPHCSGASVFT